MQDMREVSADGCTQYGRLQTSSSYTKTRFTWNILLYSSYLKYMDESQLNIKDAFEGLGFINCHKCMNKLKYTLRLVTNLVEGYYIQALSKHKVSCTTGPKYCFSN